MAAAQSNGGCTYQVSPHRQVVPQAGGWVFVEVVTQPSCAWSVTPFLQGDWADAGDYGVRAGPGWITIHASRNSDSSPRTRRFQVAGNQFWVWQPGAVNGPWFDTWHPVEQQRKPLGLVLQHTFQIWWSFWTVDPRSGIAVRRNVPDREIELGWTMMGSGDFNIDGQSDILLRNLDGRMVVWLMNDGALLDSVSMGWADPHWRIRSLADMDRDGRVDLIWQHIDGRVAVWFMNGLEPRSGQLLSPASVPDLHWFIQTSGDFNGDGWVDLIWQHSDGRIAVWFMHNTQMISGEVFATVAPSTWAIKGAGDMDGDGWPDLLWQHLNGSMGVW